MFTLLPKHRLVSADRPAGAGGTALRAGGVPAAKATETGGVCRAVWSTTGRGRPPLCRPPLPAAAGGLCPRDDGARAAEAADTARPADHPAAKGGAAAIVVCHGRPALGRSHHAGTARPPGGSRSHHPYPRAIHLSARLQPALDGAGPPYPGYGAPVA